ncbi:DNA repair protein [Phytophthora megakarya]|uniref:DNA repair protein n=1 Tax=Phytophthora megakarya TaxID=4795 RepID=A0A225X567_9STRA|nr:DNA repair protein [Phytophthora megakarya]
MRTTLDLWHAQATNSFVLPSGCDSIDELLHGGFRSGIITEICGEASAGKTQLCLQLLLQCCLPRSLGGLQGTACYICTEGVGSVKRLHDLAQVYARRYGAAMGVGTKRKRGEAIPQLTGSDFLDGIFVEQLYTVDDLMELVQARLPALLAEQNTKLVVLDSVAAVFRLESTSSVKEAAERSRTMFHMANCMRILSDQYGVVFVVTNQVTGDFDPRSAASGNGMRPALGLSWSHCINQRLMITRHKDSIRRLGIAFSPHLQSETCNFQVTNEGPTSMVATKQTRHASASPSSNNAFDGCEIRSGMSVQALKHLTAQRQRLEFWARNSPRQMATDFNYVSSPSSTCSSSLSTSPPRKFNDGACYSAMYGYVPPPSRRGFASDKMFVTCGGQVVSFMEGVVNAPQGDFQLDN